MMAARMPSGDCRMVVVENVDHTGPTGAWAWRSLRVGLLAGLATMLGSWLLIFLIDLIPSGTLSDLFSTGMGDPFPARVVRDALSPWNRQVLAITHRGAVTTTVSYSGANFGALVMLVAVFCLVGWAVRRRMPLSLRLRALTLVAAGLCCAVITSAIAALDSYSQARTHYTHGALTYFLSALVLTFLLGAFAFGIVALLPHPLRCALRRAALLLGVCFLVAGLLLPTLAAIGATRHGTVLAHFAHASLFSAAGGGLAIPLALQLPVSLTSQFDTPFAISSDFRVAAAGDFAQWPPSRWPKLVLASVNGPSATGPFSGRLAQYAADAGPWGTVVGVFISLLVLIGIAIVTVGLCRQLQPPNILCALRLGFVQGASLALMLVVVAGLSAYETTSDGSGLHGYWGTPTASLVYSCAMLVGLCGLVAASWVGVTRIAGVRAGTAALGR
jgi:hypothetical protein